MGYWFLIILSHAYIMGCSLLYLSAFLIESLVHANFLFPKHVYFQLKDNSVLINADYSQLFGASDISGNNGCAPPARGDNSWDFDRI